MGQASRHRTSGSTITGEKFGGWFFGREPKSATFHKRGAPGADCLPLTPRATSAPLVLNPTADPQGVAS
jgi:hypothetical protein